MAMLINGNRVLNTRIEWACEVVPGAVFLCDTEQEARLCAAHLGGDVVMQDVHETEDMEYEMGWAPID